MEAFPKKYMSLEDQNPSLTVQYTHKGQNLSHYILCKLKRTSSRSTKQLDLVNGRLVTEFSLITQWTL